MSDPVLGLTMLMLIVVVIIMGFPTASTLMGLGMFFGFYAFYNPAEHWIDNRLFAGMMPYILIVIVCMIIMYIWPGITLRLPNYLYGGCGRPPLRVPTVLVSSCRPRHAYRFPIATCSRTRLGPDPHITVPTRGATN